MKTKRELGGLLFATKVALGGAIGYEIFAYLGPAYKIAGSVVISALLVSGFLNLLTMLSYCKLASLFPEEGVEFASAKAAYGGFIAFMVGGIRWLSSVIGGALAAVVFAKQLERLVNASLTKQIVFYVPQNASMSVLVATILIVALTVLNIRGTKKLGILVIIIPLMVLAIFSLSGLWFIQQRSNTLLEHQEILPKQPGEMPEFFLATALVLQLFLGMRALVAGFPKTKQPEKNLPKSVVLATVALLLVYSGVTYIAVRIWQPAFRPPPETLDTFLYLNHAANIVMPLGDALITVVAIMGCISAIATSTTVQASILSGMSEHGYLPRFLLRLHHRFETRHLAIVASSLFMIAFCFVGVILEAILKVKFLAYAAGLLNILIFAFVNLCVVRLRKKLPPHLHGGFKATFYLLAPIAGVVASVGLIAATFVRAYSSDEVNISYVLIAVGLLVGLVLLSYYLRMVGRYRVQIAVGGISFGIGAFTILLSYIANTSPNWPFVNVPLFSGILVFTCIISIIAGILNIAHNRCSD